MHLADTVSSLKGMLIFNPFCNVDSIMKDSIMKCICSFQNCPAQLPEYIEYFYNVLTQSAEKIRDLQESKPTISPLKIEDRIAILRGALHHANFKKRLFSLNFPIIIVHSKRNCFVQIKHSYDIFEVFFKIRKL